MDWLAALGNFLVNEILSVPAFLIGIITAVGGGMLRRLLLHARRLET